MTEFRYLGCLVNEHGDLTREEQNSSGVLQEICPAGSPFRLKTRLLKAEAKAA